MRATELGLTWKRLVSDDASLVLCLTQVHFQDLVLITSPPPPLQGDNVTSPAPETSHCFI